MPFCPNPNCPHRKRLGEPAAFIEGVAICSDCNTPLVDSTPVFAPLRKPRPPKKSGTSWTCPECGSINREDIALCPCGFDSNRPFIMAAQKPKETEVDSALLDPKIKLTRNWLIIFGVIEVLIGLLAALLLLPGLFMLFYMPSGQAATNPMFDKNMMVMFVVMFGAGAIFFIWMGIGSILTRRWARAILIVASAYGLVFGFIASAMSFIAPIVSSHAEKSPVNTSLLWNLFMFTVLVVLPTIFFLFYRSQSVKSTCEQRDTIVRWTDRLPLPILAILLLLAFTAMSQTLSIFNSKHIVLFFNRLITGSPAMIVAIVEVSIYVYLTIAVYKMKRYAWLATVTVTVLDFGVQSLSYFLVNETNFLSAMGYSAVQIQKMQSTTNAWNNSYIGLSWSFSLILWIGFLIYVRKYFKFGIKTAET